MEEKCRGVLGYALLKARGLNRVGECLLYGAVIKPGSVGGVKVPASTPIRLNQVLVSGVNARRFMLPNSTLRVAAVQCTVEALRAVNPPASTLHPVPGAVVIQVDGEVREAGLDGLEAVLRRELINMSSYAAVSGVDVGGDGVVRGVAALIVRRGARLVLKSPPPNPLTVKARAAVKWLTSLARTRGGEK